MLITYGDYSCGVFEEVVALRDAWDLCHDRDRRYGFIFLTSLRLMPLSDTVQWCCKPILQTLCVRCARKRRWVDAAMTHVDVMISFSNRRLPQHKNIMPTSSELVTGVRSSF